MTIESARAFTDSRDAATTTAAIKALDVVKSYTQGEEVVHALRGVDLVVRPGEFLAVTGASGSGKSTLLHIIGALDRPDSGRVELEGESLMDLSDDELALVRRRRLGFVLQFFNLLPTMTVRENVAFPLVLDAVPDAQDRVEQVLESVGLGHRGAHRPAQLSGGEQQRVALARALVTRPAVVLADEPTGNLDSLTGEDILTLLSRSADQGQTIVMVTHDPRSASYADRSVRLTDGMLAEVRETVE